MLQFSLGKDNFLINSSTKLAGTAGGIANLLWSTTIGRVLDTFTNDAMSNRTNVRETMSAITKNPRAFSAKVFSPGQLAVVGTSSLVNGYAYYGTQQGVYQKTYDALGLTNLGELQKELISGASGCLGGTAATSLIGSGQKLYNYGEHYVHPPVGTTRASNGEIAKAALKALPEQTLRTTLRQTPAAIVYSGIAVAYNHGVFKTKHDDEASIFPTTQTSSMGYSPVATSPVEKSTTTDAMYMVLATTAI